MLKRIKPGFPSEDWPGGRRRSFYYVHFAFMLTQAELQVEPLQERPVDSEWPVTAMQTEHAGGVEAVTEEAEWSAADVRSPGFY